MKSHVEIGHLTKFGTLKFNKDQVMTLETCLKIHNVYNFVTASQNHINSLQFFNFSNCKIRHASTSWKELIRKSLCLPFFRNITEIVKKIKSY